jgi:hypothetical protein
MLRRGLKTLDELDKVEQREREEAERERETRERPATSYYFYPELLSLDPLFDPRSDF